MPQVAYSMGVRIRVTPRLRLPDRGRTGMTRRDGVSGLLPLSQGLRTRGCGAASRESLCGRSLARKGTFAGASLIYVYHPGSTAEPQYLCEARCSIS